jgi:hypothetical protein
MSHLGSFGSAVRELDPNAEKDEFNFFGEKFVVEGVIPPVLMVQTGAAFMGRIDTMEGFAAMWSAMWTSSSAGTNSPSSTAATSVT